MTPPQSTYHALLARALAVYVERGLPLSWPFPGSRRGATVQDPNGSLTRLAGAEVAAVGVTVLAEEFHAIVAELRRETGARG
jgi:hypothetical protein